MAARKPDPKKKKPTPPAPQAKKAAPKATAKPVARAAAAPPPAPKARIPDLKPAPVPVFGNIPWDYGQTRITAIARDPHCLFAYWEYPDSALEAARRKIESPHAGTVLRVYDTTYRLFDGTNANGYFDVPVDRNTNRYYFHVNRPATTFIIDLAVKDHEGRFATIARSGPAETPRDSCSGDSRVDWMTIPPRERYRRYEHRYVPKPGGAPPPQPVSGPPGTPQFTPEQVRELLGREGWTEEHWTETVPDGNGVRVIRWSGPVRIESTVSFPGKTFEKFEIEFKSEPWIVKQEKGERKVFGPWNVTVHGWEIKTGRQLLQRWTLHSSWVTEERSVRTELPVVVYRILGGMKVRYIPEGSEGRLQRESWSSEAMLGGASEMQWLGGSELRMAGASELMFLAASEWMTQGASEWFAALSSYALMLGGSEKLGGSDTLGGSERWSDYPSGSPLFPPGGEKP